MSMIILGNTICAILLCILISYICRCVYVCMCVYLYAFIYICVGVYVYVCVGVYVQIHICIFNKQMFVKHLPPARSEYRVPQRPITKTGTKEGQLTQRYY